MSCDAGELLPVEAARQALLDQTTVRAHCESLPLLAAQGRVLAVSAQARVDVPPTDNSAMDGYAIHHANAPHTLPVSQRIPAGAAPAPLATNSAARIFTGAAIPPGADCVVMQEHVSHEGKKIRVTRAVHAGDNIRLRGQDMRIGQTVVAQGSRLHGMALGALAAAGVDTVTVYTPLRVAIFSSGDELRQPGERLAPGQIYDANRFLLHGLVSALGMHVIDLGTVPDQPEVIADTLQQASVCADVVITSAGVSVGEEDHLRHVIETLGTLTLWRVNLKPGKPFAAGRIGDLPILALPGNPGSALVTFALLARPCLQAMQGMHPTLPRPQHFAAGFDSPRVQTREEYVRVTHAADGTLTKLPQQSSGTLFPLLQADGFARIPANTAVCAGDLLEYFPFRGWLVD